MKAFKWIAKQTTEYINRRTEIMRSDSGVSHKRYIAVTLTRVLILMIPVILFVNIPENNVEIIKVILFIFSGVIIGESGASLLEKKPNVDKKENIEEK